MALVTAAEAAQRLGVKQATLYAYVSRGVLRRRKTPDGRGSLFDAGEIEQLARRGRPRRQAGAADIVVESAITEIAGGQVRYRGAPSPTWPYTAALRRSRRGSGPGASRRAGHRRRRGRRGRRRLAAGRAAQAALPPGALPLERLQVIVPAMAAADPLRLQLDPPAVMAAGQNMIAGMVETACRALVRPATGRVPGARAGTGRPAAGRRRARSPGGCGATWPAAGPPPPCSARSARRWSWWPTTSSRPRRWPRGWQRRSVRTLTRSWPPGLGAVAGALHGGASLGAETLLSAAAAPAGVPPGHP